LMNYYYILKSSSLFIKPQISWNYYWDPLLRGERTKCSKRQNKYVQVPPAQYVRAQKTFLLFYGND